MDYLKCTRSGCTWCYVLFLKWSSHNRLPFRWFPGRTLASTTSSATPAVHMTTLEDQSLLFSLDRTPELHDRPCNAHFVIDSSAVLLCAFRPCTRKPDSDSMLSSTVTAYAASTAPRFQKQSLQTGPTAHGNVDGAPVARTKPTGGAASSCLLNGRGPSGGPQSATVVHCLCHVGW